MGEAKANKGKGSYVMVSALVLLFCGGESCAPGLGPGSRREGVDGELPEAVGIELVPDTPVLTFLPEARPKDLFMLPCPERVLCPVPGSRSCGGVPLPRSLNADRSRSLPFPYFNKAKRRVVISVSRREACAQNPFRDKRG